MRRHEPAVLGEAAHHAAGYGALAGTANYSFIIKYKRGLRGLEWAILGLEA
jgi:hypothetical protein